MTPVLIALLIATAALCTELLEMRRNTLATNGRWISTKMSLQRGVPGAREYYRSRPALSRNRLDLSPYQGFQELLYRAPLHLRELSGRFSLDDRAYLSVIFDRDDRGFSGVLFSRNPHVSAAYFEASPEGELLRRVPLAQTGSGWHHFRLILDGGQARLLLDGAPLSPAQPRRAGGGGGFGFHGGSGAGHAYVDDLEIDADEGRFSESFRNSSDYGAEFAGFLGGLVALIGVTLLGIRRRPWPVAITTLGICLFLDLCGITFGLIDYYLLSAQYPLPSRTDEEWDVLARQRVARVRAALHRDHPAPDPSRARILVLGASQAWGCGARDPGDEWTARLEERFVREHPNGHIEIINAGVVGANVTSFRELYLNEGLALAPRVLVVYPTNHNADHDRLRESLETLAEASRAHGVVTLFVLGAHEPDSPTESDERDRVMREVAARFGLAVLDLQSYIVERRDRGFLFWDSQHLTPFGQQLTADLLYPALLPFVSGAP